MNSQKAINGQEGGKETSLKMAGARTLRTETHMVRVSAMKDQAPVRGTAIAGGQLLAVNSLLSC